MIEFEVPYIINLKYCMITNRMKINVFKIHNTSAPCTYQDSALPSDIRPMGAGGATGACIFLRTTHGPCTL